jgi:hypothetical protein
VDDRFVSLASLVVAPALSAPPVATAHGSAPDRGARPLLDLARADIAQELALMRIAALESFERASSDLLGRLARDVLARELALAPVDLCALAARALAAFADHEPIALVVAPSDVAGFATTLPVRADTTLEPGDLIVEIRDGAFESRFALRVADTIATTASESLQ